MQTTLVARALLFALAASSCSGNAVTVLPRLRGGEVAPMEDMLTFSHAPLSFFALDKLTPKGPRKNADVGEPADATRSLCAVGSASAGSWHCTEGGWDSPTPRATTEIFYVIDGAGSVTDTDGEKHAFEAGDTVILPKGWTGRWDVTKAIHKVWLVHDHPEQLGVETPIRAQIIHLVGDTSSRCVYDVGPTSVSIWARAPAPPSNTVRDSSGGALLRKAADDAGYSQFNRPTTKWMHVVEGVFFVTNADGSAQRCGPGDTLVVPKGWSGHWDIIETCKAISVTIFD